LRNEDSSLLEPKVAETNFSLQPEHLFLPGHTYCLAILEEIDVVCRAQGTGSAVFGGALYLSSVLVHDMSSGNPDVTDRWCRGLQRPWDSAGRHVYILNKPEQLRGPLSPHRKDGTQNWEAWISGPSVVACVPLSTQGRLCVLDSQDSCCPLFLFTGPS